MALVSALTERAFAGRRQSEWDQLDALVRAVQGKGMRVLLPAQIAQISPLYRDVCADLSRAEAAHYSAPLIDYLQGLTAAAHAVLYGHQRGRWSVVGGRGSSLRTFVEAFPRAVRRHKGAMVLAFLLFFVPFFAGLLATLADPAFAVRIVPEGQLRPLVEAYKEGFDSGRASGLDAAMAGFYVNNNVGIALRCFATGLFFGVGSAFYLVQNGLATGAIMGYVVAHGAGDNILTFIVGHGSLELGAIVLAGGAGMSLGWSIVSPGERTRVAALQATARSVVIIVFGAAVMLFMAAAVEGFWSSSS
ncbi:MAG: stage II sporulation protein M, partial [Polyangiaceae bacterium]